MIVTIHNQQFDIAKPLDISIPFHSGFGQVNAFHAPPVRITPVKEGDFVGSTKLGGVVNFMNFQCNPHGNGTHTECVGHISKETYNVNECIEDSFYISELISIFPNMTEKGDKVIDRFHLEEFASSDKNIDALIIRTLSNDLEKQSRNYSGSNPVYLTPEAMEWIVENNYKHLLVDIPSVDREEDGGALSCHKIFWNYPDEPQTKKSITELIFVPNEVKDGIYLLKLNFMNITMDAAPSKPTLYCQIKA
jgi:kynurenine formamidase